MQFFATVAMAKDSSFGQNSRKLADLNPFTYFDTDLEKKLHLDL
jgi:hypothetical protein